MTEISPTEDGRAARVRVALGVLAFLVFAGIGVANHEMWRDEHHAWLLARDAASPVALFENLRWDMTPGFWHLLLWVVTRFTHDPLAMQLLNLAFATAAAWVVLRHAPWSLSLRLLVVFGYYFAYEYAVISRVYALGTLFIVVLCALWKSRAAHPVAIGVLLTLLAHTPSLYGVIAAGFFLLLLVVDLREQGDARVRTIWSLAIGGLGAVTALIQTLPRSDNPFAAGKATLAFEAERLERVVTFLASLFVPIPDASRYDWWNSNLVTGRSIAVDAALALGGLALVAWVLWRSRVLLACWGVATAGVLFAAYQGGFVGMRHGSYVVILFVAALWLAQSGPAEPLTRRRRMAVVLLMAIGVAGWMTAWAQELGTKFSAVEETAQFLRENDLDRVPMAGADDFVVASLASLLDLDGIYYPQRRGWGTFVRWDPQRGQGMTLEQGSREVAARVAASNERMIFVLTVPPVRRGPDGREQLVVEGWITSGVRIRLLGAFTESVVADERMFVYAVEPAAASQR
ncbi:MAG: hypothetical protein NDJ92_11145 [Thermoanaerobaculia bacterium]|nr:hypothetical protein [Thermoanaerobaculia bacterium]